MLLGVLPIETQLRVTKSEGEMKRKNKRSKFLFMLTKFLMAKAEMFEIDGQLTSSCICSLEIVMLEVRDFHRSKPENSAVSKADSFLVETLKIGKA